MTLGEVKRSNINKFQLQGQLQRFFLYQPVCVFSQIKDRKHIKQSFHSVCWGHAPMVGLGVLGGQKL